MLVPISDVPALVVRDDRQAAFLAALPRIEAHARATFAHLRCPHHREDAIAEVIASAWERYRFRHLAASEMDRLAAWAVAKVRAALKHPHSPIQSVRA